MEEFLCLPLLQIFPFPSCSLSDKRGAVERDACLNCLHLCKHFQEAVVSSVSSFSVPAAFDSVVQLAPPVEI